MDWVRFCEGKAEECERTALETRDPNLQREWETMAVDWLLAAFLDRRDGSGEVRPPRKDPAL